MTKKQKILELRDQGLTYNEISKAVPCSKSLVCYYLGDNQQVKNIKRQKLRRKSVHPYEHKLYKFSEPFNSNNNCKLHISQKRNKIQDKIWRFHRIKKNYKEYISMGKYYFTVDDIINKYGENPTCYLTGQTLDINKTKEYEFDHIIPRTRGGTNSLDNLGICTSQVNKAKANMTPDEFINLCKQVVQNSGYKLIKISDVDRS